MKNIKLKNIETIVEIVCIFLISLFLTSIISFIVIWGDLIWYIYGFGILHIPILIIILLFIIGAFISTIILLCMYYREWKKKTLSFTQYEIGVYVLVILFGLFFFFITHSSILPLSFDIQVFILDISIIIEIILFLAIFILLFRETDPKTWGIEW